MMLILLWGVGAVLFASAVLVGKAESPERITDAVIVFTGGTNRVKTGLGLLAHQKSKHVFISGVYPDTSREDILAEWKSEPFLPKCCIDLGRRASTTVQNAAETKEWLEDHPDIHSVRLVTSDYHMNRALIELQHAAPNLEILPYPVSQPDMTVRDLYFWKVLFEEYHKTFYRWIILLMTEEGRSDHGSHK